MKLSPIESRMLEIIAQHQQEAHGNPVDVLVIVQEVNQPVQEVEDALEALEDGNLIKWGRAYGGDGQVELTRHGRAALRK